MFEAGATHALGPEIYEEQASWWEECVQAAFATVPWIADPTPAMCERGADIVHTWGCGLVTGTDETMARDIWQAMYNEAIAQETL